MMNFLTHEIFSYCSSKITHGRFPPMFLEDRARILGHTLHRHYSQCCLKVSFQIVSKFVCFFFYSTIRLDLKICWFAVTRVCFFEYTRPVGKIFFYHFEMEKIAVILIYNIFVTKKSFFKNEHHKKILTRTFLVDPVG